MKNLLRMSKGRRRFNGFTLVELVVVVAVVGVLAAVAAPKLLGVGESARKAQLDSIAGALSAAAAGNYSKRQAQGNDAADTQAVANCAATATLLDIDVDTASYTIAGGSIANAVSGECTITTVKQPAISSTFSAYGTI